ncbi:MAG TPA: ABC transporter substrate-binding protein [Candidatus Deferrimicrobiaceae bacterium]|jgi:peptide/nickel transport system substrate-binding protein
MGALLLAGILAISGCRQRLPVDERTVVIALSGAPSSFDPRLATDAYSEQLLQMTHAGLMRRDTHGDLVPDLAQDFEMHSPVEIAFHLRPDLRFHDGREVTATDVRDTFVWILDSGNRSPHKSAFDILAGIDTPDRHTVVFRLKSPYAPFLAEMTRGIVPSGTPARGYAPPIGAGPFKVEDVEPGDSVSLARFDGFFGGPPAVPRIVVKFIPDSTLRFLELKMGSVNFVLNGIDPEMLPEAGKNPNLVTEESAGGNVSYLGFNLRDPVLADIRVRRAIALAIDRGAIIRALWKGKADPADSILAPGIRAHADGLPDVPYDPVQARRLLDQAGHPDPDGEGPAPRFTLTYKTSQNALRLRIATAIQDQLRQVGIALDIRSYEWGTFFGDIRKGNFQLYSLTWVGLRDPDIFHLAFHSKQMPPDGANRNRYENAEVDRLTEAGQRETDPARRKAIYDRVQRILARDLPVFPLWANRNVLVRDRRVTGFTVTPEEDYTSVRSMKVDPPPREAAAR